MIQTVNNTIYLIDATNYLFRSYYAIEKMTNDQGESTHALFGFIRSVGKLIKDFQPDHLVAVFDAIDNKKERIGLYKAYKGHRKTIAEDLIPQIELAKSYCTYAGISHLEVSGVEGDDTIGSIAKWGETKQLDVYICSSDKDFYQLLSDHIFVLKTSKENALITKKTVQELYKISPEQMVDYLAIVGDASDAIPGISGCGPKTASKLLDQFGSLQAILNCPTILNNQRLIDKFSQEKEQAILSKNLATIRTDLPIPKDLSFYKITPPQLPKLKDFYQKMQFASFLKEIASSLETGDYTILEDRKSLQKMIEELSSEKEICIDTETTELNPMQADIIGIGLSAKLGKSFYIPVKQIETSIDLLKPLLENPSIGFIGHNIKYDMHVLLNQGIKLPPPFFDTRIASHLLNAHNHRHNLDQLVLEKFHYAKIPIDSLIGKKKNLSMKEVPCHLMAKYCAEDVYFTQKLKILFQKELQERSLWKLFSEIEMPLIPVLFQMERSGIFVDVEELSSLSKEFQKQLLSLKETIFFHAKEAFNINSPKQLGKILFEKLGIKGGKRSKLGYATGADILESLVHKHPIIENILEYRTLEKLRSTYVDALPAQIDPKTNRIHSSFNQSVTATGRLSSTHPNLQNIPIRKKEGKIIRKAFKSGPGNSFISADYSQIELRLLAHFSEDPYLIQAFANKEDIHRSCASMIFGIPLDRVTEEMRAKAKAVNFGLIYGQQAFSLSRQIGIPLQEAHLFIDIYFKKYPKVRSFLESCKERARQSGKTTTLFHRQRLIPEITSKNNLLRLQAERLAINTPIQGSQADIIKLAMIQIDKKFSQLHTKSFLVLQIHDELIFECPDSELPSITKTVSQIMESVVPLKVPLKVDISIGKNWQDC